MRFVTENELNNFIFDDAVIQSIEKQNDHVNMILDNVRIKPENNMNRDIITKRTNDLLITIPSTKWQLIEEGYQLFDADLNPIQTIEDRIVKEEDIAHDLSLFNGCYVDEMRKEEDRYILCFVVEDHTWRLEVEGKEDKEAWNRFFNIE